MEDTIAAISTPAGNGGIAVIRVSGADAVSIADRVFRGKNRLSEAETHTLHYGFACSADGTRIDEVLAAVMRAPRSFTREDVVEISTHGGFAAVTGVLDALIRAGARMAEPGEFTKRAFLNGRIDLSQAEAVIDMINAKNDLARRSALSQLEGTLSKEISSVRGSLVNLAARMQVLIDYPDEDLEDITEADIADEVSRAADRVRRLLATADSGRVIRDGVRTAIVGKPNVGKSSLMNLLAGTDRAIVTDIAGTTRDIIEESINLDGVPLVLIDTAGIRETADEVERIGVERSRRSIAGADLVLVMLDSQSGLDAEDEEVLAECKDAKRIVLVNKTDLGAAQNMGAVEKAADGAPVIAISAKTGSGREELAAKIRELYSLGESADGSRAVITNMRHKTALIRAEEALRRAAQSLGDGMPQDIVSIDINEAIDALGEITGETVSESVAAEIFHSFCVGK